MKKIALILIGVGFLLTIVGCSDKTPTPQERFKAYLDHWQKQNFAAMYDELSTKAKQQISKKDFVNRYKEIYQDFEVRDLTVKPKFKKAKDDKNIDPDEDGKVTLPFSVQMNTMAGPVHFTEKATLVKEERKKDDDKKTNWYVKWNTKMIFPQMTDPSIKVHGETLPAKRGEILDRNGRPLAVNGTVATIGIWPGQLKSDSKQKLSDATGIPVKTIEDKLNASWVQDDSFVPITKIPVDQKDKIAKLTKIPGVKETDESSRVYPDHEAAGHLTGYIGGVTAEDLKKLKGKGYDKSSVIGKTGLEKLFEKQLRGKDGAVIYTTDKDGNRLKTIANKDPKNGQTIQLTIDTKLQKKLYEEITKGGDTGTAAAINPKNGQVLALVSAPGYDPNDFALGISDKEWKTLQSDPHKPLLNRFTQAYAPGSSFKPITAAIALKTESIDPNQKVHISGPDWQPDDPSWGDYKVHRVDSLSEVNLQDALVHSDNIYFAQTALKIGADKFLNEAKNFGLGEKLPSFPVPIEAAQISNDGKIEGQVQLANSGYGQAQVATSALQLAIAYTPFINDGNLLKPTIELENANNNAAVWHKNVISPEIVDTIEKDLIQVVQSPHGTGHAANIDGLTIAGKTGTAELKKSKGDKNGKENGWFVAFNTKDPKIMISMMIEDVKHKGGSHHVVPKVADVLKSYLK